MPTINVYNATSGTIAISTGYYTGPIAAHATVSIDVPDTNEFKGNRSIASMITAGQIVVTSGTDDTEDRPLANYTTATLPAADSVAAYTPVWDTTTRSLRVTDGTSWSEPVDGGAALLTAAATAIAANRFVGLNTAGRLAVSPVATERWAGVTSEAITGAAKGRVITSGNAEVMPSATIAANNELVCVAGGFAAPFQAAAVALGTSDAGADASDDILQTNLPDQISVICAGNETGNTVIIYGDVGGTPTKETVTLGVAGTYTSTATFTAVYGLRVTAAAVAAIDIIDATLTGVMIPQIAALTAARFYGAVVPSTTTASVGHTVQIVAGGANTADVMLWGTDYAGAEQFEVVTMTGTTIVPGTVAFRTLAATLIGADGIAWNAGVTSQYTTNVAADMRNAIRAYAYEAEAVAGATVGCTLLPQNFGLPVGKAPAIYYNALGTSWGGGGVTNTYTIPGIAATDVIHATIATSTNSVGINKAVRTATDTITVTFTADPGAATVVGLTVYRP